MLIQYVFTVGRRIEQPENRQQRRLAASGGSGNRKVLAFFDIEMNARERMRLDFVGIEDFLHVRQVNKGIG